MVPTLFHIFDIVHFWSQDSYLDIPIQTGLKDLYTQLHNYVATSWILHYTISLSAKPS